MKHLVLLDFDGTITTKDTLLEVARFSTNFFTYYLKVALFIPIIILMKSKLISAQRGKELFLKLFFGHLKESNFNELCKDFAQNKVPGLTKSLAYAEIKKQVQASNRIVIVSASPENWIKPWTDALGIEVIATKLKFENDRLKGIEGINCNGEEKVRRINELINLKEYDKVIAYGDTKGDLPMLALADEKHFKPFR